MDKIKVKVQIGGADYALLTDQSEEVTKKLADEINTELAAMKEGNPFISANQAAVLVALGFAEKAKAAEDAAESYREQIKDYLKDASEAQSERDFYKRELDRLRTESKAKANQMNLFAQDGE